MALDPSVLPQNPHRSRIDGHSASPNSQPGRPQVFGVIHLREQVRRADPFLKPLERIKYDRLASAFRVVFGDPFCVLKLSFDFDRPSRLQRPPRRRNAKRPELVCAMTMELIIRSRGNRLNELRNFRIQFALLLLPELAFPVEKVLIALYVVTDESLVIAQAKSLFCILRDPPRAKVPPIESDRTSSRSPEP